MNGQINEFPLKPSGQGDKESTRHGGIFSFFQSMLYQCFFFKCNNIFISAIKCLIDATERREKKSDVCH